MKRITIACSAILLTGIIATYLLTMRYVAIQCIEHGGWDNAFHHYECRAVL